MATETHLEKIGPSVFSPGRHIPALDGLRGIAILLVVLFHVLLHLQWESATAGSIAKALGFGWLGVDIFFVLSGFLITGILLDTRHTARRFKNFYARRFLRIIPVYYLMLAVIFVMLPIVVPFDTDGLRKIQANQGWMWTHMTNLGFVWHRKVWASSDWLALDHLWSLAVEEQFYLAWPLVVYFFRSRTVMWIATACLIFSTALRAVIWLLDMRNGAIYFPTPCRLDGLALGAIIAIFWRGGVDPTILNRKFGFIAVVAIGLLGALIWWRGGLEFTDSPTAVFAPLLINVLTACTIIFVIGGGISGRFLTLLTHPALTTVGKYSYGLYLFHSPLLIPLLLLIPTPVLKAKLGDEAAGNIAFAALYFTVSFAAAFVSWHGYEKHWLKLKSHFAPTAAKA